MDPWHNNMINAGKELPRGDDLAKQLVSIVKILHMMPALKTQVLDRLQAEVRHYLARPNDFIRTQNGEIFIKDPNVDYRRVYVDKATRGRGW